MTVVTQPFNLGNTLLQAGQIKNVRATNRLRDLQAQEAERVAADREAVNALISDPNFDLMAPGAVNELARVGGLPAATSAVNLQGAIQNLETAERAGAIEDMRFLNAKARAIAGSANPRQRLLAEMQDERFGEMTRRMVGPQFDPSVIADDELMSGLSTVIQETDFVNAPDKVSTLLAGPEAEQALGLPEGSIQPGTVLEAITDPAGNLVGVETVQKPSSSGSELTVNPDGTVTFTQGGGSGATDLSKPTINKLQTKLIETDDVLAGLRDVQASFRPEFQQVGPRLQNFWTSIKAKGNLTVTPEEAQQLNAFANYKRNAIDQLNRYIKLITGAQMSEAEANRLRQGFPDPGEGIFDGDDPISFQAKMDGTMRQLSLVRGRTAWALKNGLIAPDTDAERAAATLEGLMSLDQFEQNLEARFQQLTEQNMAAGMNEQTAMKQAQLVAFDEFGMN